MPSQTASRLHLRLVLWTAATAMATAPCANAASGAQEIFRRASAHVVALELADEDGKTLSSHTAIALDGGRFVTTCEILSGVPQIHLVASGDRLTARLAKRDPKRNLCLLESSTSRVGLTPSHVRPNVGDRIYAVSNALGLGPGITEGVVSGVRSFNGETYIQFTAPIAPGSEGGGLFDAAGELVGVIDYQRRDGQNINFAVPAQWIGEIGARHDSDENRINLGDRANVLARQQQWQALLVHAQTWTAAYPDDANAWLWQAAAGEALGETSAAERSYREVLRLEPASLRGGLGLARVLLRQDKGDEARRVAKTLLALRREDADVWLVIGQSELSLGNLDGAGEAFRRTVELYPWALAAYDGLAKVALQRGDADALVAVRRQLADLQPDDMSANLQLAFAYLTHNRPARALQVVERMLQLVPDHGDAWHMKGRILVAMERPLAAIEAFKRSLAGHPFSPAWAWSAIGDTYASLGMWREAIAAHRESVRLDPATDHLRMKLGIALKDSFAFDEAMAIFKDYVAAHPNDDFGWRQVGYVHGYRNQPEDSIAALQRSLSIDPRQAQVWHALMEQYYKVKRRDELLRAYEKLRSLDPARAESAYQSFVLPGESAP